MGGGHRYSSEDMVATVRFSSSPRADTFVAEIGNREPKGQLSPGNAAHGAGHKLLGWPCVTMGCRLARPPCSVDARKGPLAYEELDCDGSTSVWGPVPVTAASGTFDIVAAWGWRCRCTSFALGQIDVFCDRTWTYDVAHATQLRGVGCLSTTADRVGDWWPRWRRLSQEGLRSRTSLAPSMATNAA